MAKKKVKRKSRPIVIGLLEKISSGIFERYPEQVTGLIKQGQGVYALYRRHKLYYIGLASDLERRIKWHLRDRHKGKWDRFSLYIFRRESHIREVESLLVRIAEPGGNRQRGRLKGSKNLVHELDSAVKERQKNERVGILGDRKNKLGRKKATKRRRKSGANRVQRPLEGVFPKGKMIYATYKGKSYKALVNRSGRIELNGQMYDTPSGVGKAILDAGAVNGWHFWKYKDKDGNLVPIKRLRK